MSTRILKLAAAWLAVCAPSMEALAETCHDVSVFAEGLVQPWSAAWLPDGALLVTERPGRLRTVSTEGGLSEAIEGLPTPFVQSQAGFFDVRLHPDFLENRLIYVSYATGRPDDNTLAVGRGRLDGLSVTGFEEVFRVHPSRQTPVHYGGKLAWLPDGTLLLTSGDAFDQREQAQDRGSQLGKVLRMADDGSVPTDNPFAGREGVDPYIFTLGHRNPQGLAVDVDGAVYLHEHGPRGGDEINQLVAGRNYGWPIVSFGVDYSGAYVTPFKTAPGYEAPLHHWTPSIAPSGMAIYRGNGFAAWSGDLLIGALVDRDLKRVSPAAPQKVQSIAADQRKRIRDVLVAHDGEVVVLTAEDQGQILRISPCK
ncbi:MAG: PQQ-dependent sugar dehydrogenase [Pseudomonadota bacterium]